MKRFVWLVVLFAIPLLATTVVPMSVERLTEASTHVVIGEALESRSQWNQEHTQIFTYTRFRIGQSLKGNASGTIVVKQMGGRADGYEQKIAGVRQLQQGEKAVLFVHPSRSADGTVVVTGVMQGNFRVVESTRGEAVVSNGVSGADQLSSETGRVEQFGGKQISLSRLVSLVRAAQKDQK